LCVAAILAGWGFSSAAAQDSVLGLPTPNDKSRPGAILLHGGGQIMSDVFQRFIDLSGGEQAHIVLVPSAGYRHSDYESEAEFREHIESRFSAWVDLVADREIASFEFLYTDDSDRADDEEFLRPLANATGVWFSGGAQERLNYRFVGEFPRQTGFQLALRQVLERGGVVGGTSAGMAALPEIMTLSQDRDDDNAPLAAVAAHGLGLFTGAIVEQHFNTRVGRLERFTGLLRNSGQLDALAARDGAGARMVGLAVEERAALVLQGNRLQVLGEGNSHVFLKSKDGRTITWHGLSSGDTAELKRDELGVAALERDAVLSSR
jgi:cyanophycinase